MKRIIVFLIFVSTTAGLFAQSDFIYSEKGEKLYFKIRNDKLILKTKSAIEAKALSKQTVFRSAYDVNYDMVIITIDTLQINRNNLMQKNDILDVTCALEYIDGTLQYPSNQILVRFKEGQSKEKILDDIGLTKSIETVELFDPYSEIYIITLNVKLGDILQICRNLFESGFCTFAEPSFFREIKLHNTLYQHQWGLKNTGQNGGTSGIDIKAEQAWTITRGSADIKVAVIDEGVDLTHPDLQANLLPGYDATVGAPGGANGSAYGDNDHGTACAGIIGAVNNAIGITGVASSAKIISIRVAYTPIGISNGSWITNDTWLANGIRYAWDTAKADVLNNSWGGGSPSQTITNEINNAVTFGRLKNGVKLGCIVVFAGGNTSATVDYPANLSNVIAVGAIDHNGLKADFSNYGEPLDIVAPGVDIYTTGMDVWGSGAIDLGINGIYLPDFGGTSAATPFVSGVAALVLSVNSTLKRQQVENIIESTAQKVRNDLYSYSINPGHPNGTWNDQMGYGLVNAYAAVQAAVCVNNFTNQTVTNNTINTIVIGCSNLNVQNVTVSNNAKLTLDAPGDVIINSPFEVQFGSQLDVQ